MPEGLWRGAAAEHDDHPTAASRERSSSAARRPAVRPAPAGAVRTPEAAPQMSRSRLPLPPVPAASRAPVPAGARTPAASGTSAAPFRPGPSPEPRDDDLPPARMPAGAVPARSRSGSAGPRSSAPAPRVPRQINPAGAGSPAYGDWTKPSRDEAPDLAPAAGGALRSRTDRDADRRVPSPDTSDDAPAAVRGPASGPVVGGRAAVRAERQAADMARRKAAKRNGTPIPDALADEEDEPRRPRRVVKALLAMTVVALGVLGVYSYVAPGTQEAGSRTAADDVDTNTVEAPPGDVLPALPTTPTEVEPVVAAPVKAPVTVLNGTEINGLAAKVATALNGGGWETPGVGGYTAGDVAASTVFFTEGDETQRQAALQLVDAYPQLQGPTPRFFDLPADVTAPGLVVVLTGDWTP